MVFAAGDHVRFYSSPNLLDWTFESIFGRGIGAHGGVWECPDLFPMEVNGEENWVLLVSINPGGPNGGSATQYFIGNFDGTTFQNDNPDDMILWLDYGGDNYAGVTWSDIPEDDGRRIFMGWMSNWSYATAVPTEAWRSAMTVARTLELTSTDEGHRLISKPVMEMDDIRGNRKQLGKKLLTGESEVMETDLHGPTELILEFKLSNGSQFGLASQFGVKLSNNLGEEMVIGYEPTNGRFFTDRTNAGKADFNDGFAKIHYAPYENNDNTIIMHLLIDVASVELFAEDGKVVMTDIFFPNEEFNKLTIYAKNGSVKLNSAQFIELQSIW
jgi:fructan beta-fructosidase